MSDNTSDFGNLLHAEFSRNVSHFKAEMERINSGQIRGVGSGDPTEEARLTGLVEELKRKVEVLQTSFAAARDDADLLREELVLVSAERDDAIANAREQLEDITADRDLLERELAQLRHENRMLQRRVEDKRDEETKSRLEDKYRRALVYIDALQAKLANDQHPLPVRSSPHRARPFR